MHNTLNRIGYLATASRFKRISEHLQQDGDKIYQQKNIRFKASWFSVYYVLAKAEISLTVLEISQQIDFTHITVKNVLSELSREKLVVIKENPKDKRSKLVALSTKGRNLLSQLEPIWLSFSKALQELFQRGNPDMLNILNRLDYEIKNKPIHKRIDVIENDKVSILDYKPSHKGKFTNLTKPWLLEVLGGQLEVDDQHTLGNPEDAYLTTGGFIFFAKYKDQIAGCVALKRLDENSFEFAKLFVDPNFRKLGIATKLIERCISRCMENEAKELWLQTTMSMPQAHQLYYKLGFQDQSAPKQMEVLARTEKIMSLSF